MVHWLEEETRERPHGKVIESDVTLHVPAMARRRATVVPRHATKRYLEQPRGHILDEEEAGAVKSAAERKMEVRDEVMEGVVEEGEEAIDGKHPQVTVTTELLVALRGGDGRPDDLR